MYTYIIEDIITAKQLAKYDRLIKGILDLHIINRKDKFFFAIHELIINTIEVYEKDSDLEPFVKMILWGDDNQVSFSIIDKGKGINQSKEDMIRDFIESDDPFVSRGRGIYLIEKMVDEYKWFNTKEGFRVEISIKLD